MTLALSQLLLARGTSFFWSVIGNGGVWMPFSRDLSIINVLLGVTVVGFASHFSFYSKVVNIISKHAYEMLLFEGLAVMPFAILRDYVTYNNSCIFAVLIIIIATIIMFEGFIIATLRKILFGRLEDKVITKVADKIRTIML